MSVIHLDAGSVPLICYCWKVFQSAFFQWELSPVCIRKMGGFEDGVQLLPYKKGRCLNRLSDPCLWSCILKLDSNIDF